MRGSVLSAILVLGAAAGCAGTGGKTPAGPAATSPEGGPKLEGAGDRTQALVRAAREAEAALDRAPLDPARMREAAAAEVGLGHPGRAHALFLSALFLLDHPAAGAPAAPFSKEAVEREARAAERTGSSGAGAPPSSRAAERHNRARDDALRLYRERDYAGALEKLERLTATEDPKVARWIAACNLKIAAAAAEEGRFADAVARLWRAADADPAARTDALYRDVARLERRLSVACQGRGDAPAALAALRRAHRAAPGDLETLYLLARRSDLPAPEKAYYEALLRSLHPDRAEAEFLEAARAVRAAPDAAGAAAAVDRFVAANPAKQALIADLRALLADRSRGEAAKDAASARARYESALEEARASRSALEGSFAPEGEPAPAPEPAPR